MRAAVERVYAVGDVHGRFDLFRELMNIVRRDQSVRPPAATQIVLLGNIVDWGADSARMVRGCMELTDSSSRFTVIRGNHEDMMAEALAGDEVLYSNWLELGGRETLRSWGADNSIVDGPASSTNLRAAAMVVGAEVISWLTKLPLYHRHDDFLFVHAGIRPGVDLADQDVDDLLWITDDFLQSDVSHGFRVVHGHTSDESGAVVRPNRVGIDTGAYRTGKLTALGIEGSEIWSLETTPAALLTTALARVETT